MMETRPRYRPEWTETQKLIEVIAFAVIALVWVLAIFSFFKLPQEIPVHFNAVGEADGYGDKYMFFLLPMVMTAVYVLLTVVSKYPWQFNYMVRITEENYREQYGSAVSMLRVLKLCIAIFSLYLTYGIISTAKGKASGLSPYALVIFLAAIFSITGYSIFRSIRNK